MASHLDLLEATYDGAIPPAVRAAADARDRASVPVPLGQSFLLGAAPPKRRFRDEDHAVAVMARLMADRAGADESCSERDLACAGFTAAEIARFEERARAKAAVILADRSAR